MKNKFFIKKKKKKKRKETTSCKLQKLGCKSK